MVLSGPTSCGKTTLVLYLLQHSHSLIDPSPQRIVWLYKRWQPLYDTILKTVKPPVEFMQDIPVGLEQDSFFDPQVRNLIVLDDLMSVAGKDSRITDLFTEGSHHRNLSVMCLNQNLYFSKDPTQRRNSHYVVLFKNPIDKQQVMTLARQMYPENTHYFMKHFDEATRKPYGYLMIDLKQATPDSKRLRPNVFQEGSGSEVTQTPHVFKESGSNPYDSKEVSSPEVTYTPIVSKEDSGSSLTGTDLPHRQVGPTVIIDATKCPCNYGMKKPGCEMVYKKDTSESANQLETDSQAINMHHCAYCGALFQSPQDLQRHILKRCPERDDDEGVPSKRFREDSMSEADSDIEDDSVFDSLVDKAYEENEKTFQKKVKDNLAEGMKDDQARKKAKEDVLPQDRRVFLDKYGRLLEMMARLNHNSLHRKVTHEIDRLMLGENYSRKEAINPLTAYMTTCVVMIVYCQVPIRRRTSSLSDC